ncbi:MAG: TrmH family RNA methyltransferase [Planctomycetota bacterium]|nr:TrmH family RNA methyltransferase [Planctomycetaceae bacterium]MDQ3331473.1 TrmH family RNA methyltransferase [Planctomycetota bacterium]
MPDFIHERHKPPTVLERPRELLVACAPLRSSINLSRIVRAAGCSGVTKVIATGSAKLDRNIARDGADAVELVAHRTLPPVLKKLRTDGYRLVGLEQATNSHSLYDYKFVGRSCLVVGNERTGLTDDLLELLDDVVEIPSYGMPYSHNVATATAIAIYEYCRQFPSG